MVTVACVLKSGGCYTPEYVRRLREGVRTHLPDSEFVCFSDVRVPCEWIPLEHDWPGWWSKLEVFRMQGPVLYFDLDTIITGSLEWAYSLRTDFAMLRDFYRLEELQSGVMYWRGNYTHIYRAFRDNPDTAPYQRRPYYGDGGFIAKHVPEAQAFQDLLPGEIVSRKAHDNREGASVVCYHGPPRPHETGWAP